jgi:prepilin-type N-terminal cleavage/methylation domain-containing protein
MIRREAGFTLIELMVTMLITMFVLAAASQVFTALLTQFKQQSKVAETGIESVVGLEILRKDLESSGYGLPWSLAGATYQEAVNAPESAFNDATANPPRALASGNDTAFTLNSSDYLVIKSIAVARNGVSRKWTTLSSTNSRRTWDPAEDNLEANDRVIVLTPGLTNTISLVSSGGTFFTKYDNPTNSGVGGSTYAYRPPDISETRLIYGVDPDDDLWMPFNRADYYISTAGVPQRCAPNTGVLVKAVLKHADGTLDSELPIMDCVADMQVVYRLDMDDDGSIGTNSNADGSAVSSSEGANASDVQATLANAALIRQRLKEVRVYILAHEGQREPGYAHSPTTVYVGDTSIGGGHNLDISADVNYRWKVYSVVEKPKNLR